MKKIVTLFMAVVLGFGLVACGTTPAEPTQPEEESATLSGEVSLSGSTSVEKIGIALGDEFMALNPDVDFTYQAIGSSAGVKNANEGVTMIGTASRNIKDSEKELGMTEQVLCYDGIAVIVNNAVDVDELTLEDVQKIYKGEITNWSEVGGSDVDIVVVSREQGSGTRGAFEEIVGFEDELTVNALLADGNGNVHATVKSNAQAIGYISFTTINDEIKPLKIEGSEPTVENVLDGSFKVSRPFNIIYHDANLSDAAKKFLQWVQTDEAKDIIEDKGGIAIR